MREERKFKASHFENIQELIASCIIWIKTDDYDAYCRFFDMGAMEELIKELNNLKEIEKSHQEENGKLRVELEQEKEKNKELEKQINLNKKTVEIAKTQILEYSQGYKDGLNKETTATAIVARELELNFIRQEIKHKYISKYKIIEKLQELENKSGGNSYHVQAMINAEKNILKELLEEK